MKTPYYLAVLLAFQSCHSVSDQILQSFKKVNHSLETSNRNLTAANQYSRYYFDIQAKATKNTTLAASADTLYKQIQNTLDLLASIHDTLQKKDSAGDNTIIASQLLTHTTLGDSLWNALVRTESLCEGYSVDPKDKSQLQETLRLSREMLVSRNNYDRLFPGQPTVAALTSLNSFKLELLEAAAIALKDIDARMQ